MPLRRIHFQKLVALLQKLFLPARQLVRAVYLNGSSAQLPSLRSRLDGPGSAFNPARCAFDEPPISGRAKRSRQLSMVGGALRVPVWIVGCRLWLLLVDGLEPLDGDVQIAHGAKMGVQPFQFAPYLLPLGVGNHRRKKG